MLLALIDTASGMIFKLMRWVPPLTRMFAQKMIESESLQGILLTRWADMVLEYSITWFLGLTHVSLSLSITLTHLTLTGKILQSLPILMTLLVGKTTETVPSLRE